jgi:CP family cyanate transporter-like MFS transporter
MPADGAGPPAAEVGAPGRAVIDSTSRGGAAAAPLAVTLAALFVAALALRPNLIGLGPLLPQIIDDMGIGHGVSGLLATIPVVCMGLVAPFASQLASLIGARRGVALGLLSLAVAGTLRAVVGEVVAIVALTIPVGLAIGIGGALLPVVVKERLPLAASVATGVYTTAIQLGASISAFLAVPIGALLGGWRGALVAFSAAALVALVAWLVLTPPERPPVRRAVSARGDGSQLDDPIRTRSPWRDPMVWLLAVLFWLCAFPFYGLISWLGAALVERGWPDASAGAVVALVSLAGLPGSLLIGWTADRIGSRRGTMVAWTVVMTLGVAGFVVAPALAPVWALVAGLAIGATFTLTLILPLDLARDGLSAGRIIGVVLSVGYVLTGLTPVLVGIIRDVTGSFDASLWLLVVVSALVLPACIPLTGERLRPRAIEYVPRGR